MADSRTIQIVLKALGDFSDVQSNIKSFQNSLNQLKLNPDLKQKFTGIFSELEKEAAKYQKFLNSGFKTKGDVTGLEKSGERINQLLMQLQGNINKIDPTILQQSFNVDPSKITELNNQLAQAQAQLKAFSQSGDFTKKQQEIQTLIDTMKGFSKSTFLNQIGDNIKAGNIEAANQALEKLIQNHRAFQDTNKETAFQGFITRLTEEINKLANDPSLAAISNKIQELQSKINNLHADEFRKFVQTFGDGKAIFEQFAAAFRQFNIEKTGGAGSLHQFNSELDQIKYRVQYFFGLTNAVNLFKRAIRSAFNTVKELDVAMTETAVVTKFSVGDMWDKLPEYSKQATELGTSIKSLYEATTLYYQQGLNTQQAMEVGIETMKMARIAGTDAEAATQAMTAALRGFNMEINEMNATRINDVYSKLAAITASDTQQIATAMFKTASIAANANMEFETTAALLAQIIETTQEAPETAGTAMKTIIARFTEVKQMFSEGMLTGEDEEGEEININKIDAALKNVGISLKDFLTGSKGIDDIFLELASKWDSLDIATQRYIATTAAGSRQQSRFIAMMSNYGRTVELVSAANNSAGASQKQFDKTLESMEAKLQKLSNAWNTFVMGIANNEAVKFGVDILTKILETVNNLTNGLGGLEGAFAKLAIAIAALKIGRGIFASIFNLGAFEKIPPLFNGMSTIVQGAFAKIGIAAEKAGTNVDANYAKFNKLTTAGFALGTGLGLLAQYFRKLGHEELANGLEKIGGITIALSGAFSLATIAAKALNMELRKFLTILVGKLVAAAPTILAIGAALYVVVAALKAVYKASPAGRLEDAKKATEQAANAAKDAAEAYTSLKNSLDGIGEKTETLGNLTKGTIEWKEAVMALNNEILTLVEKYPELASFINSENGVLTIDYGKYIPLGNDKVLTVDSILNQYLNKQAETQRVYNSRQIDQKNAEIEVERSKIEKEFIKQLTTLDLAKAMEQIENGESQTQVKDAEKAIEDLSKVLASGEIEPNYESVEKWLEAVNFGIRDLEEFDLSALRQYGQYLIKQEAAIDGLTEATIAASIAMANFENVTPEAAEVVSNINTDVLKMSLDGYIAAAAEEIELGYEDYKEYGEMMGYTVKGSVHGTEVPRYYDQDGKEVYPQFKDKDIKEWFATQDFTQGLENLAKHYDSLNEDQKKFFTEVLGDREEFSYEALSKYGVYSAHNQKFTFDETNQDQFAIDMGFKDFGDMAKAFEIESTALAELLDEVFVEGGANFIESRKALVKDMTRLSKKGPGKDFEVNANLLFDLQAKYEDLDISSILADVIEQLDSTGDEEFANATYEAFRDIMQNAKSTEEMQQALEFFNKIDFSNPIEALDVINNEIKTGTGYSKELAMAMKNVDSSYLGLTSQFKGLADSEQFEDIKEDLDEILQKNNDISATDVYDLTKSYKSLDKILKNNEISAEGLAEILEQIAAGKINIEQLTDTVFDAISSFEGLNSIAAKTVLALEDFDLGIDENVIGETAVEWGELIEENLKKGAVGNAQNFKILDYLFPGWSEGLEGEALITEMTRLATKLKGNGQNLRKMWSELAAGKDFQGQKAIFDGTGLTEEEKAKFSDLKVQDIGDEIIFSGWEGKNLTSEDLVAWISDAYKVSNEMASMMLTDFKNYSADLAEELNQNDYAAGIQKAYEGLRQFGDIKLIDQQEIELIAQVSGKNVDTVLEDFSKYEDVIISDFYTADGKIKSLNEIQDFMNDLDTYAVQGGRQWQDSFFGEITKSSGEFEKILDVSQLEKELGKIGISGLNAEELKRQAFEALKDGMSSGAEEGKRVIETILDTGEVISIEVTTDMTYEDYIQQLTAKTQRVENEKLAGAIADALGDVEVRANIDESSLVGFRKTIESVGKDPIDIMAQTSEDSLKTIDSDISEIVEKPRVAPVTLNITNSKAIDNIVTDREMNINLVFGIATNKQPVGEIDRNATGLKNAPRDGKSLVSEEGPELIQKNDGTAYLTGTSGPEIVDIDKGDTIYTADETQEIFKKRNHSLIPRFSDGKAHGYGSGTAYGGKGAGSKSDEDKEDWENPFDKLYNLVREINEELRRRERLERRYEKLLESVDLTAGKLFDNAVEQLRQLEKEKLLNKELQEARRSQIQQYQQENSDLMKYAKVVQNENGEDVLRIHWDQINLVEDPEQGQRIEDYVSQLEEWFDSLEEAEDKLNDIEDRIEEVKELGKEEYLDFENAVKDAITFAYQEEIDKLSEINESINDTNTQLIDAISKQVSRMRQQRENERAEEELQEKQRQLLYLSQDTSGANDLAILELQREIEEGTVDYTDTLIDQKIDELQMQNDEAAQQREQQITLMQAQLDHLIQSGEIWDEVYSLMDEGLDQETGLVRGSRLEQMLKSAEGFQGMSKVQQMDWLKELQQQAAQAVTYMRLTTEKLDTSIELDRQQHFNEITPEPEYNGGSSSNGSSSGGGSYGGSGGISNKPVTTEGEVKTWKITTKGGNYITTYTGTEEQVKANFPDSGYRREEVISTNSNKTNKTNPNNTNSNSNNTNTTSSKKKTKVRITYGNDTVVTYDLNSPGLEDTIAYWEKQYGPVKERYEYKRGGLADFTGPAWLDGTKAHPELVLNARDTQNFIQLKDILASLMTNSHISTENNGDIIYDIDINVESIGSDYDVEQVANKVKSLINEDARYRNNNAVSLKR